MNNVKINSTIRNFGDETLKAIALTIIGDNHRAPYITGPQIIDLFNNHGFDDSYENFGTRWRETLDKLTDMNGTLRMKAVLRDVLDPRRFIDTEFMIPDTVAYLNKYLAYDGCELIEVGMFYDLRPLAGETPVAFEALLDTELPKEFPAQIVSKIHRAVELFRKRTANLDDKHEAVRNLADSLEYLRPEAKRVLNTKDESDLFTLANNFGIRHHSAKQKTNYDSEIWLNWMFYYYLATIHAIIMLLKREPVFSMEKNSNSVEGFVDEV